MRSQQEIARAHASVLLDLGKVTDALTLLRRLNAEEDEDAYVAIRLVEALRRSGDERGAKRILKAVLLDRVRGDPAYIMALVQAVAANEEGPKAHRANPNTNCISTRLSVGMALFFGAMMSEDPKAVFVEANRLIKAGGRLRAQGE